MTVLRMHLRSKRKEPSFENRDIYLHISPSGKKVIELILIFISLKIKLDWKMFYWKYVTLLSRLYWISIFVFLYSVFFLISKVVDLNIDILKADKDNSFPFKSRVKHYLMKHFIVIFCNERRSTNVIITWIWT